MPIFPISLAVFNFVPVGLTGVALWFLVRFVRKQDASNYRLALLGGGLILAGGLSKALWKLIAAASGADVHWLANALFPLMAPGFAFLLAAVWGATRRQRGHRSPPGLWRWAIAAMAIALTAAAVRQWMLGVPRGWFLPLLILASLGNLGVSVLLIRASLRQRRWHVAALFAVNLAMIFALQPIAMATPKTLALHWIEQTLTALGTGCFALAAFLLHRSNGVDRARDGERADT